MLAWSSSISSRSLAAVGALVTVFSCRPASPPVARLEVTPHELELAYPRAVPLRLTWRLLQALESIGERPTVFVHLFDHPRSVARTFDHPFPEPWVAGGLVEYEITLYESALGPPLPPGEYWLSVGLYTSDGRRWPVEADGDVVNVFEHRVARANVSTGRTTPEIDFSSSWSEVRAGFDRQVLGRRILLTTAGTLRAGPARVPSRLFLTVYPAAGGTPHVESTCGAPASRAWGFGTHEFELPMSTTASCEIRVEASPPGLSIEALAWKVEE
jgi:hypothetical protein